MFAKFANRDDVKKRIEVIRQHNLLPEFNQPGAPFDFGQHKFLKVKWPNEQVSMAIFRRVKDLPDAKLYLDLADKMVEAINRTYARHWKHAHESLVVVDSLINRLTKG